MRNIKKKLYVKGPDENDCNFMANKSQKKLEIGLIYFKYLKHFYT